MIINTLAFYYRLRWHKWISMGGCYRFHASYIYERNSILHYHCFCSILVNGLSKYRRSSKNGYRVVRRILICTVYYKVCISLINGLRLIIYIVYSAVNEKLIFPPQFCHIFQTNGYAWSNVKNIVYDWWEREYAYFGEARGICRNCKKSRCWSKYYSLLIYIIIIHMSKLFWFNFTY